MKKLISILGMLILLTGSAFIDHLFYQLEKWDHNLHQPGIPFWAELPIYVVFALLLLCLAWYELIVNPKDLWGAFIFIFAGLAALLLMSKFGYFEIWPWIYKPPFMHTWLTNTIASPIALTRHAAAFVLIIGLVRLFPGKFVGQKPVNEK